MTVVPDRKILFAEEIQRCQQDFVYFAENYLKIIDRDGKVLPLKLKAAQKVIWDNIQENPWQCVLKARQMGSSTIIAAILFWKSLFNANERSLVVAHTHEAVKNIYRIYKTFYEKLPQFLRFSTKSSSANEIVFFHGGTIRIASATSQNYRGATYNNIHASEMAFWRDTTRAIAGLFQTATGNSHIIIETTANGLNGFHQIWQDEESGFGKTFIDWTLEPDYKIADRPNNIPAQLLDYAAEWELSDEQLNWAAETLKVRCANSWPTFLQEYAIDPLTCFISSGDRFFDKVYEHATFSEGYKQYEQPKKYCSYVLGADTASGSAKGDYSAFAVIEITGGIRKIVATYVERITPLQFAKRVLEECNKWNCVAVIESNSYGLAVIEYLRNKEYSYIYTQEKYDNVSKNWTSKLGFATSATSRPILLSSIQSAINSGKLEPSDERLRFQMNTFVYNDKGRPDHSPGTHDDLIFAVALALQGVDQAVIETTMKKIEPPTNLSEAMVLERKTGKNIQQLQAEGYFGYITEEESYVKVPFE